MVPSVATAAVIQIPYRAPYHSTIGSCGTTASATLDSTA